MDQRTLSVCSAALFIAMSIACSSESSAPLTPTPPTVSSSGEPNLKVTAPTPQAPINDVRLETFTQPTLSAAAATPVHGGDIALQYEFELLNEAGTRLDAAVRSSTTWTPTAPLEFDKRYNWRVRAVSQGEAGPWSALGSFMSPNGGFIRGVEIFDPLTNGQTVGVRKGGKFVSGPNGGWESTGRGDGIWYDIPTCAACKIEFDVTNFGKKEGERQEVDFKWLSMGDANTFGDFFSFRNSRWKMHLEQRSDGDGTGMMIIWRNGTTGEDDPEYGDHRSKFLYGGPDFKSDKVFHYVLEWTRTFFKISVGECPTPSCQGVVMKQYFPGYGGGSGWFGGGHAYEPPNHRIQLGCTPRNESFPTARFRNVRVTAN